MMTAAMENMPAGAVSYAFIFLDIVGYSRLPAPDQLRAQAVLNRLVSDALRGQDLDPASHVISPAGDGMAVGLPEDKALEAFRAGLMINKELAPRCRQAELPSLGLRMGLHLGEVIPSCDINGRPCLVGHGINQGQRIMDFGDAGHLLCSSPFREKCLHLCPEPAAAFRNLGPRIDKHGYSYEVWNVFWEEAGNPLPPSRGLPSPEMETLSNSLTETITTLTSTSPMSVIKLHDLLKLASNLALEWDHPYIGLEHLFAGPLKKKLPVSLYLQNRGQLKLGGLLTVLKKMSWQGKVEAKWPGTPLTPAATMLCHRLGTDLVEEVMGHILRQPHALPALALRRLKPELDLTKMAEELWPGEKAPPSDPAMKLHFCNGPEGGRTVSMHTEDITLGRASKNSIVIPYDIKTSREHARIYRQEDRWFVQDLKSKNGVLINDKTIAAPSPVSRGDLIGIGNLKLAVI